MSSVVVSEANAILREIEQVAQTRFLPIIGPVKGKYLVDTVKRHNVKTELEVGTLIGYSAILTASNMPPGGKVTCIEINPASARTAAENVRKANLSDKVEIITGDALRIIPTLSQMFDMVFLDAEKSEYLEYLKLAEPHLKQGGVVFADNVKMFARDVADYLDYVRNSGKYSSRLIDVGFDGMEISERL